MYVFTLWIHWVQGPDISVMFKHLKFICCCLFVFLLRQGGLLVNFHPSILTCLLPQLTSPRLAVRKRTIIALGHLVMSCGNIVFVDLIEHLLSELSKNDSMSTTRTYIQCIAAISRQAGHRIGKQYWNIFKFSLIKKVLVNVFKYQYAFLRWIPWEDNSFGGKIL